MPQYGSSFGQMGAETLGLATIECILTYISMNRASVTWSVDTSHSITASQNRSSVYGMNLVRATLLNILKWALCGLYKKSGLGEMRFDGVIVIRYNQEW